MAIFFFCANGILWESEAIAAPEVLSSNTTFSTSSNTVKVNASLLTQERITQNIKDLSLSSVISLSDVPTEKSNSSFFLIRAYRYLKNRTVQILGNIAQLFNLRLVLVSLSVASEPCTPEDPIIGTEGPDELPGIPERSNTIRGKQGNDTIQGQRCEDYLFGDDGNDNLKGDRGKDELNGGPGNDQLDGDEGADTLDGDEGEDTLKGGDGRDFLSGGPGNDILQGGDARDMIYGNGGDDKLFGNKGNDRLNGGPGNDLLDGGAGRDRLKGGSGEDRLRLGNGDCEETNAGCVEELVDYKPDEDRDLYYLCNPDAGCESERRIRFLSSSSLSIPTAPEIPQEQELDDFQVDFIFDSLTGKLYSALDISRKQNPKLVAQLPIGLKTEDVRINFVDISSLTLAEQNDLSTVDLKVFDSLPLYPARVIDASIFDVDFEADDSDQIPAKYGFGLKRRL